MSKFNIDDGFLFVGCAAAVVGAGIAGAVTIIYTLENYGSIAVVALIVTVLFIAGGFMEYLSGC